MSQPGAWDPSSDSMPGMNLPILEEQIEGKPILEEQIEGKPNLTRNQRRNKKRRARKKAKKNKSKATYCSLCAKSFCGCSTPSCLNNQFTLSSCQCVFCAECFVQHFKQNARRCQDAGCLNWHNGCPACEETYNVSQKAAFGIICTEV